VAHVTAANGPAEASQTLLDNVTPITVVRSYDHLRHAIADWCEQIHMTRAELDAEAGLADGHSGKLLARRARKRLGPVSLGRVLEAAGLLLILARDPDTPHRASTVASTPRPRGQRRRLGSAQAKRMAALRALKLPAPRRSEIARNAAIARHQRRQKSTAPINNSASPSSPYSI
jgi:hypothetical protein